MLLLVSFVGKSHADDIDVVATKTSFKLSFEELTLHEFADEKMGLMGGNILFQLGDYPWLSLGGASYGTLTGSRGGFITIGLASDVDVDLTENLSSNFGLFVGAGGGHGGYQLQGGGLMLRGHLGLAWKSEKGDFSIGLSRVDFPNGHVASNQVYTAYTNTFSSVIGSGWLDETTQQQAAWDKENKHQFALVYKQYAVPSGIKNALGREQYPTIGLMGVEWKYDLEDGWFVSIESEGAMSGKSNGYMQILLGGGMRYHILDSLSLELSASAGVAGGGNVETGGGLLTDIGLALQQNITNDVALGFEIGWVDSLVADFHARSYAVKINHLFATPLADRGDTLKLSQLGDYDVEHMRIRFVNQSYSPSTNAEQVWRTHHANLDVQLLGFQYDSFIGDNLFLTGQAISAYEGEAGGYITGLVGLGFNVGISEHWNIESEMLFGAAGGGGLAVGGGLVWQINAGLSYAVHENYDILMQVGRLEAPKGDFSANVLSVAVAHKFSLFM